MSPDKKRALGRGLDALLPTVSAVKTSSGATYGDRSVFSCPIESLHPQKGQPRQRMDGARLDELAASLREHGLIEPLVVRRSPSSRTGSRLSPVNAAGEPPNARGSKNCWWLSRTCLRTPRSSSP